MSLETGLYRRERRAIRPGARITLVAIAAAMSVFALGALAAPNGRVSAKAQATADLLRVLRDGHSGKFGRPHTCAPLVAAALRRGADPNAFYGTDPSNIAAGKRWLESRLTVGPHFADTSVEARYRWTAFMMATGQGDLESMNLLIAAGANPRLRIGDGYGYGQTLVGLAVNSRSLDVARRVLSLGADPNECPPEELAPLEEAVGSPQMTRLLLERGADPLSRHYGRSALSTTTQMFASLRDRLSPERQAAFARSISLMENAPNRP